jgi:streptogramin lyase
MRTKILLLGALVALASTFLLVGPASGVVSGTNVLYTLDADFDQGTLVNLNHDAPNANQLQLNTTSGTFPFIWIALSLRCTIAKVDTTTGAILGEYRTISDEASCAQSSRTTVGLDGSVWVGHRGPGGVTHVGLAELSQCVDRNGNGTIETSTAYGDVKAWSGSDSNVANAADECILHHVNTHLPPLSMSDSRHMSIDASNKLWVGDYAGGHKFVRINGTTGAVETPVRSFACGGYGGLIDANGVIWSANGSANGLLRWDPDAADSATNPRCVGIPNYGLAVDPTGNIWATTLGNVVYKVSADGNTILGPFPHGSSSAQGLAVTSNGHVWVSSSLFCGASCTIGHLDNNGVFIGNVPNPTGAGSTGVSVDAAGKIWTANLNSNSATRIDPTAGVLGSDGTTPVGAVDLTVNFPATPGRPLPSPYNYSDMTGAQLLNSTAPQGTWTVTQDGTALGTDWGTITWNTEPQGTVPAGASLTVEARAADTEAGLGSQSYVAVSNGAAFDLTGRFIQVRVTFKPNDDGASPILSDIRIQTDAPAGRVEGKGTFQATGGRGQFQVNASPAGGTFHVKNATNRDFDATSIDGFATAGNAASFHGNGTWEGAPGYTYTVRFVDNGFPGREDTIDVVIRNPAGAVVFSSNGPKVLKTGDVTVTGAVVLIG